MQLFRPTGQLELERLFEAGMRAWPPRLAEQPIFYPVLNLDYAQQIARQWNTKEERRVGYVTRFALADAIAARYARQVVGASVHEELWIPAEDLPVVNHHLEGPIELVDAFFGEGFVGHVPKDGPLTGLGADDQLEVLAAMPDEELHAAVSTHRLPVFLHHPYWSERNPDSETLAKIASAWPEIFPTLLLLGTTS